MEYKVDKPPCTVTLTLNEKEAVVLLEALSYFNDSHFEENNGGLSDITLLLTLDVQEAVRVFNPELYPFKFFVGRGE